MSNRCSNERNISDASEEMDKKQLVDVNALVEHLRDRTMVSYPNLFPGLLAAVEYVEDFPTVDAVEVVRCKECKHFDEHNSKCYVFCNNEHEVQLEVDRDHFCSYGERIIYGK